MNPQFPTLGPANDFEDSDRGQQSVVGFPTSSTALTPQFIASISTGSRNEDHFPESLDTVYPECVTDEFLSLQATTPAQAHSYDHSWPALDQVLPFPPSGQYIAPVFTLSDDAFSNSASQNQRLTPSTSSSPNGSHLVPNVLDDACSSLLSWSTTNPHEDRFFETSGLSKPQRLSNGVSFGLNTVQNGRILKDSPRTIPRSATQGMDRSPSDLSESSNSRESADAKTSHVELRRQRNNVAAQKYRQKRLDRIAELEQALVKSEKEKNELQLQVERWKMKAELFEEMAKKT